MDIVVLILLIDASSQLAALQSWENAGITVTGILILSIRITGKENR